MADDWEAALTAAEEAVAAEVRAVLDEIADEFAAELDTATELIAARFRVSSIGRMFRDRIPRLVRRLFRVAETAAEDAAATVDADLPDGWDDLPGRYDDGTLPTGLGDYADSTEHLLRAVGDRLADAAVQALAEGLDAGEDIEGLRARLRATFAAEGAQLGETREERIARTEAARAWNTATLAAAQELTGPERPIVKQWQTRRDTRVRDTHNAVDGQLRMLDEPFTVAGVQMSGPGDPTAPPELVINCFPGDTLVEVPSGVRRIFRRWYEGPLFEVHTKDGGKLAGTPNHPLLTDAGWKALEGVEVGDQLIGAAVGVRVGAGDPQVEDGPTSLAELYRAAHEAGMPSGVVGSGVDFHGDAAHGDVEVVAVHGDLRAHVEAAGRQGFDDTILDGPGSRLGDLAGAGDLGSPGDGDRIVRLGVRAAAPSSVETAGLLGGGGQGCALLEREALHAEPVSLAGRADRHPVGEQTATDDPAVDLECAGEGELRLPGLVSADDLGLVQRLAPDARSADVLASRTDLYASSREDGADTAVTALVSPDQVFQGLAGRVALHDVIRVERRWYRGHVYNLETEGGWYIANDIASHNCRCVLRLERRPEQTASDPGLPQWLRDAPPETVDRITAWNGRRRPAQSKEPARAASEIPRQITASARANHFPYSVAEVTHPEGAHPEVTAAGEHTGGMIALIPTADDAERLALEGGEPAGELHVTLFYLGDDATQWDADQRAELIEGVRARAAALDGPVRGRLFGVNHWNPHGDDPVWVWAVSDDGDDGPGLLTARHAAIDALEDTHARPDTPRQHSPWVAHLTGVYTAEEWPLAAMADRLGEIRFDRIRVAFGGEYTDLPIGPEEGPDMPDQTAAAVTAALPTRSWSTPDQTALAFENQQTGDGRIFAAGALYWEGSGPWPLQYADEMLMGHEGAELAGAIQTVSRDGDRIPGSGVLYLSQRAGADAALLLEQNAPLGVSVDLDDVDIELVDNTATEGDDGLVLAASIPALSVLRLEDGGWTLTASSAGRLTASGTSITRSRSTAQLITGPGGQVTAAAIQQTLHDAGVPWTGSLTAAAGDPDTEDGGVVVHSEESGAYLLRITRARLRGATLVSMPAFAGARIVLDPIEEDGDEETAAAVTAATPGEDHDRVVRYVCSSPIPVGAREVSKALGLSMDTARGHLTRAANAGRLVRLAPGMYVGPSTLPEGPHVEASAGGEEDELVASLWTAMRELPPMPAEWFREPTPDELPPGSGGVHVAGGRIFGWVAQAGVPHAGYPGKNLTIERLASQGLDLSHFLRAKFTLDDGSIVKAGAFTMNAPHHRDGAECETAACQFDDSRTVAGIVTVGMNAGGMWFAGAANPYLSEWDRTVFKGCQPSYHLRQERGRWELRAVLTVPVPGHSSPLLAAAVVERTNLALTAAAALADAPSALPSAAPSGGVDAPSAPVDNTPADQHGRPSAAPSGGVDGPSADVLAEALSAALARPDVLDTLAAAVHAHEAAQEERRAEIARLAADLDTDTDTVTAAATGDATKGDN